jgi:Tol biopolymer transport system component
MYHLRRSLVALGIPLILLGIIFGVFVMPLPLEATPLNEPGFAVTTQRASVGNTPGTQSNGPSTPGGFSSDGRFLTFVSTGSTLVANDTNGVADVFLRDRFMQQTERLSVATGEIQANAASGNSVPVITPDGRYVLFSSLADNLVADDSPGSEDVFLRDRHTATTIRVSVLPDGSPLPPGVLTTALDLSEDARFLLFATTADTSGDAGLDWDLFLYDRLLGSSERISTTPFNSDPTTPAIEGRVSADGHYVVFSHAAPLLAEDTNGVSDIYRKDRQTGTLERLSLRADGTQSSHPATEPFITPDARYVVFVSADSEMLPGGTPGIRDVYRYDRATQTLERVHVAPDGSAANGSASTPSLSHDGTRVIFASLASNLVLSDTNAVLDIFLYDMTDKQTRLLSVAGDGTPADQASHHPRIAGNGAVMAYASNTPYLVPGDTNSVQDVFVAAPYLRHPIQRVSLGSQGEQGDLRSVGPSLSATGQFVAFDSFATNLVPGDTNQQWDAFVRDQHSDTTERVNVNSQGQQTTNAGALRPKISPTGQWVVFDSNAPTLALPCIVPGRFNVFVRDRFASTTECVSLTPQGGTSGEFDMVHGTISADGQIAAFVTGARFDPVRDTGLYQDIYARDRSTGMLTLLTLAAGGKTSANGNSDGVQMTPDARYGVFRSAASNMVAGDTNETHDIYRVDRLSGMIERVSVAPTGVQPTDSIPDASISDDGRWVVFRSTSDTFTPPPYDDLHVYLKDMQTGDLTLISTNLDGSPGNHPARDATISGDGNFIAFTSHATDLVSGDPYTSEDLYLWRRDTLSIIRIAATTDPAFNQDFFGRPALAYDGSVVAFDSRVDTLVADDTNATWDVFVYGNYTAVPTPTPSPSGTASPVPTASATRVPSATSTMTLPPSSTATATTATAIPGLTPSVTVSGTPTATSTPTAMPSVTQTVTRTPQAELTPSPGQTATLPAITATASPSAIPTFTPTIPMATLTPTAQDTLSLLLPLIYRGSAR